MPYKAKKPCTFPGCPSLTPGTYCDAHSKAEAKRYNRYERDPGYCQALQRRVEKDSCNLHRRQSALRDVSA
ncbi:hypothetical protein FACS1894219_12460 [Clostridia bacterium]|nr:hypothetical protein FACS1894219_12460 [Clostridia bacterium]